MDGINQAEIIKYLFGLVMGIGGAYVVLVVRTIGNDIKTLKEFFVAQINDIKKDIIQNRKDIQNLYNLVRATNDKTIENTSKLEALKEDHDRRHKGN